tara:strand:+ start:651 stop:1172 length:522 start_codon:yes stop_codon:yes gene_type:complete
VLFQDYPLSKLLTTITLLCFSVTASADMSSDESLFLFCSETNNSEYQHLVFLIAENGWLYDAVTTKEARLKAYGLTPYSFQTLSPSPTGNSYFEESWVHQVGTEYTLLTTSNFSREFFIDLNEKKFHEIDSGVENLNLSGTCTRAGLDAIAIKANKLESEFQAWAKLQRQTNY